MRFQSLLTHLLAPIALVGLATSATVAASPVAVSAANGGAQGRWFEVGPRAAVLHGLMCDDQGIQTHRIRALLVSTAPSGGAVYGVLDPIAMPETNQTARQEQLLLYGEFARASDGSGVFDAVIVCQLSGNGPTSYTLVGAVQGVLDPAIAAIGSIDPSLTAEVPEPPQPEIRDSALRLLRTRTVVRAMLNALGILPIEGIDELAEQLVDVETKGAFRARWHMR